MIRRLTAGVPARALLLLCALLGFGLLAISHIGPREHRAAFGSTQWFERDFEPGDATRRMDGVFDAVVKSTNGEYLGAAVAEPGGEGVAPGAELDAVLKQVVTDLERHKRSGGRANAELSPGLVGVDDASIAVEDEHLVLDRREYRTVQSVAGEPGAFE